MWCNFGHFWYDYFSCAIKFCTYTHFCDCLITLLKNKFAALLPQKKICSAFWSLWVCATFLFIFSRKLNVAHFGVVAEKWLILSQNNRYVGHSDCDNFYVSTMASMSQWIQGNALLNRRCWSKSYRWNRSQNQPYLSYEVSNVLRFKWSLKQYISSSCGQMEGGSPLY